MKDNPFYEPYWINNDELEHHGVKGMHWGERRTPEQLGHKPKGKKKSSIIQNFKKKAVQRKKQAAKAKAKKQAQNEKKKEELTEKQKEQLREKLLKSTDAKFLAKHIDLLDTKEIKERLDRIDTEAKLKKLTTDDKKKKQVDKGMEWVANIGKIAEATSKVADAYSKVYDASTKRETNEQKAKSEKAQYREQRQAAEKLNKVLSEYSDNQEAFKDIQIDFDPKSGKLSFKANKKEKDKK